LPNYHYICKNESCNDEFETQQSMKSSPLISCDVCGEETLERVIHAATAFVKGDPKTIGLLAERNTNKMSASQRSEQFAIAEQQKYDAKVAMRQELIDQGAKNLPAVPDKVKLP
jgi:putative FmdB family regulatory protein